MPQSAPIHPHRSTARKGARRAAGANGRRADRPLGPSLADFAADAAYKRFRLPADEVQDYDGRYEVWDSAAQTALMLREPSPLHELPSQVLAALAERIAQVRGKPIRCYGSMDLALLGADGRPRRIMQADQSLYLHPERANIVKQTAMVVGEHHYPDVVLEVDRSTDVRRHKLKLYEAWGFPEVWVDVPEQSPRPRKARGATIYLLAGDAYSSAPKSRAFPGWTAAEIHTALNEPRLSKATLAVLERLGAVLGEREGTGPDDDPLLRSQRAEARAEGRQEGRTEARQEAHARELASRARLVRQLAVSRGVRVGERFPMDVPGFEEADVAVVADAALRCSNAADFTARLRRAAPG